MTGNTPVFAYPYPQGTDLIRDGDNAMQALAERIETRGGGCVAAARGPASSMDIQASPATVIAANAVSVKAGHLYRITAYAQATQISSAGTTSLARLMVDGAEVVRCFSLTNAPVNITCNGTAEYLHLPSVDASTNFVIQAQANAGALRFAVNQSSLFVEDLGVF